jgi:copper chaperone CopZ
MLRLLVQGILAIGLVTAVGQTAALATSPAPAYTTIQVTDMHCAACAKKIAAKLYAVPGVLEVRADVKSNLAYVSPQRQKRPSVKAIWEAVESAGFEVKQISGPEGKFTKKPQS